MSRGTHGAVPPGVACARGCRTAWGADGGVAGVVQLWRGVSFLCVFVLGKPSWSHGDCSGFKIKHAVNNEGFLG